jgi:hypothetical protein
MEQYYYYYYYYYYCRKWWKCWWRNDVGSGTSSHGQLDATSSWIYPFLIDFVLATFLGG